jgi:membrane-associated protease RseP (regulator of RpoE activity)
VSIQQVAEDSPAAEAGLTEGDTITAIDDEPVTNPRQVIELVQSHEPGDTLTLTIKKAGDETETTVEVTIGEDPDQADAPYLGVALGYMFHMMGPDGETIFEMAPGMRLAPNFEFHRRDVKPFDGTFQFTPDSGDFGVMIWTEDGSL